MRKRSSSASGSSHKRAKLDRTNADPPGASGSTKQNPKKDIEVAPLHDSKYYFDDGNLTFSFSQILFKVHRSLLTAQSEDFFSQLDSVIPGGSTATRGASDEDAIVIPNIQPSQFRSLMKVIYCLPGNNFVTQPPTMDKQSIVCNFDCSLDIALLSRKFAMGDIEQWTKKQLGSLVHKGGETLVAEFDTFYEHDESKPDDLNPEPGDNPVPHASYYSSAFRFIEAIKYARAVSDDSLLRDILCTFQLYCIDPDILVEFLVSYLKIPDLRETDPSLFGFFFLALLHRGNQVWIGDTFTQADRVALFSAQSFLTLLPESLKTSLTTPLFVKPVSANDLIRISSNDTMVDDRCHGDFFYLWSKEFPADYYQNINSKEFSVSIQALTTLPSRRLNLGTRLRQPWHKCKPCYHRILERLDEDIQEVFTRLVGYYNAYE
ncbi:unnamed protein product [Rhizoctonia solani]|uniref:BTB domain-containing protein n=1 Tax=Rhizoctonia solani TaxID=456999 RepID=A0A8H3DRA9_9AGAM|nr:unnamed protein product [Rhizoctonia solani]